MTYRRNLLFAGVLIAMLASAGCARRPQPHAASLATTRPGGQVLEAVEAACYPPPGWTAEALKETSRSAHQVWISPSGCTAYGVIHFSLPWPVGPDLALRGFLREMQKQEGQATLLDKRPDEALDGLRFEARGTLYHLWGNLMVRGWEGWAVYAGSRANDVVIPWELELAVSAREMTQIGLD